MPSWRRISGPALGVALLAWAQVAAAGDCGAPYAGPMYAGTPYYYSSACFPTGRSRVVIKNEICSVAQQTLAFYWTRLNWASGASGVEYGGCLFRENGYSGATDVPGSVIRTNLAPEQDTNVYAPDLGASNHVYTDTVEGGGTRVSGGGKEPFRFRISYRPNDQGGVTINADMAGEAPVFYLALPPSIRSQDDLKKYVGGDYVSRIAPLVDFGSKALLKQIDPNDRFLLAFYRQNEMSARSTVRVAGEGRRASVAFSVAGKLADIVPRMLICLGQGGRIATCFQGASR